MSNRSKMILNDPNRKCKYKVNDKWSILSNMIFKYLECIDRTSQTVSYFKIYANLVWPLALPGFKTFKKMFPGLKIQKKRNTQLFQELISRALNLASGNASWDLQ